MTTTYSALTCHIDMNQVATVILNRPQTHNALDDIMVAELTQAIKSLEENNEVRIIVLKSNGQSFCAGANLQWMQQMAKASKAENLQDAQRLAELMHTLYACKKPTVALVQGAVFGGGIGLVACCQIVIAAKEASFCFSEVKLGLIPAVISPYVINAIGSRQARSYFLTAEIFDADTAFRLGLCQHVVENETLEAYGAQLIDRMLLNAPQAMQEVNLFLNQTFASPISAITIEKTAKKIAELRTSTEGQEGIAAFLEKRKPHWTN